MAETDTIHADEVLAFLEKLERSAANGPAGFTTQELCRALGVSAPRVQERLRGWIGQGLVEYAGRRRERRIDGAVKLVPVYRLVQRAGRPGERPAKTRIEATG